MGSTDLDHRPPASPPAGLADDLPQWRDRLERLWRVQVEEIIELSLAYHEAASDGRAGGRPELLGAPGRQRRRILARTALAHHSLAEIEAALRRIDVGNYGICEQCALRLQASWLKRVPQIRYCPNCRPQRHRRR
jgi:DnaK suppressor protein